MSTQNRESNPAAAAAMVVVFVLGLAIGALIMWAVL